MRVLITRAVTTFVLCAHIASLFGSETQPATKKVSRGSLTFAERVAYQQAIEEVYWRHRIWPRSGGENPAPKPLLDAVMSQAQLERKVADYLGKSQLAEDQEGAPITASELQAEMVRMASHTKEPDVLRELFAALGNDPFVIAECLARPIVAEHFVQQFNRTASASSRAKSRGPLEPPLDNSTGFLDFARNDILVAAYSLPEISVPLDCTDNTWVETTPINPPAARYFHTAVWTGTEMIVWGGFGNGPSYLNTGGRYNPSTDSWTATSITNAPVARYEHTAVWTGSEMIVWGGTGNDFANAGGRYNPSTDSWTATSTTGAPAGRYLHTAVWTGSQMIVWGGLGDSSYLNTGGRYNPTTNTWTPIGLTNVPFGRAQHTAVWTGSEMIIWSGFDNGGYSNTGGRYNPGTDSWIATNTAAPAGRSGHTAVWIGSQMIIWGGQDNSGPLNTGGRYDPGTDIWTPTTPFAPDARQIHTAAWTGSQMIIWGGAGSSGSLNTGARYCAQPSTPIVQSAVSRKTHGSVGNFDVDLLLSGTPGVECRSGGAANDYTIVLIFLANVSVNGNPQAAVTSGIGTVGSTGVSNAGMVITSGNVVTIPLTNVSNAQTINVTLNDVNGSTNVTIPMRVLIGDVNGTGTVNSSDVVDTKMCAGQTVSASNFRCDVDAGGAINATDLSVVKSESGSALP